MSMSTGSASSMTWLVSGGGGTGRVPVCRLDHISTLKSLANT